MLRRVRKGIRIGPRSVRALLRGLEIGKKTPPQISFNNPRSSIKPKSAPDPINIKDIFACTFFSINKDYNILKSET